MTKHISTMILWILVAGLLLYVVQHAADLANFFAHLSAGVSVKGLFQHIDTLFK